MAVAQATSAPTHKRDAAHGASMSGHPRSLVLTGLCGVVIGHAHAGLAVVAAANRADTAHHVARQPELHVSHETIYASK